MENICKEILHINCNYLGTQLHQLMIKKLIDKGVCCKVFVPVYDKNMRVIDPIDCVTVSECFKKNDRFFFLRKQRKIFKTLECIYDFSNIGLSHAYTLFTDGNIALSLKKKYGIPYVVAVRNTDVNYFFKLRINLRRRGVEILEHADSVFFLSPAYKEQVLCTYVPEALRKSIESKSYVIPNGIDDFWLENSANEHISKKRSKNISLIYAGRINKNKNIQAIQGAMDILKKEGYNINLTVIGKIDDFRIYKRIIKNTDTKYLEAQPKEKLIEIYREGDIFVMPSHKETFGLVYAEAMSQGLPVVYTRGQGFDGHFLEGLVGYSVNSKNVRSIADAIKRIDTNYEKIQMNCVEAAKRFAWSTICDKYIEIYSRVLNSINL